MQSSLRDLITFMHEEDHQLPVLLREGSRYMIRKHYERIDGSGYMRGRPVTELTIDVCAAAAALAALGSRTVSNRDGRIFVLHAEFLFELPGGYPMHHISGIRVGQHNVTQDECFVIRMPDGSFVQSATEKGLQGKLVKVLRAQVEMLSRPLPRVGKHILPRMRGYVQPQIVIGELNPDAHILP